MTTTHHQCNFGICRFVNVANVMTHVVEAGVGLPIVLIHGGQAWAYTWRYQIQPLAAAGYHIVIPDLPGSGYSDLPSNYDYSIEGLARFLGRLLDSLEIEQAVFAASSAGGLPILDFAIRHRERVAALVLASTCGVPHNRPLLWRLVRWPVVGELTKFFLTPSLVGDILRGMVHDDTLITEEVTSAYYQPLRRTGAWAAQLRIERTWQPDWVEANLTNIAVPTLVIWGENDPIHPLEMAREFGRCIQGAQVEILRSADHLPHEENPQEFNRVMLDFLARHVGRRQSTEMKSDCCPEQNPGEQRLIL